MNFEKYKDLISSVSVGKQLPDSVYVHSSALSEIPEELTLVLYKIAAALKIPSAAWNILKLYKRDFKVAFLNSPEFDSYSYPAFSIKSRRQIYAQSDRQNLIIQWNASVQSQKAFCEA